MPYAVFTKLFGSLVQPIIAYSASIWCHKIHSSIQAIQNWADRYFWGAGRKTPLAGVQGDMGWKMSKHRLWLSVTWQWCRLANMDYERVNRKVFVWSERLARNGRRNVHRKMMHYFEEIGMNHLSNINHIVQYGEIKADLDLVLSEFYEYKWYQKVSSVTGFNGTGRNKLRTYKNFKRELSVEHYVEAPLSRGERSAMKRFCNITLVLVFF